MMKEVANLLILDKSILTDEDSYAQIFSHINIVQVVEILREFQPDE
jgi:hypothetical protein